MNSTVEFAGLRFVSRNVGRCVPPLYRYEAETVMSLPIARSTVNSAMLISGRSSVGDRYWIAGFTAVGRRRREHKRILRCTDRGRREVVGRERDAVVRQRARNHAVARTAVIETPAAANDRRVRAVDVVGETDTRAEVVLVLVERHRRRIRGVAGELDAIGFGLGRAAGTSDTPSARQGSASAALFTRQLSWMNTL